MIVLDRSASSGIAAIADLPDPNTRKVMVVTENTDPPLQFVDPASGKAVGWKPAQRTP